MGGCLEIEGIEFHWLGHSAFKLKHSGLVIYFDPYQIKSTEKADIVFITHEHYDHCSPEDIAKIQSNETTIVCNESVAGKVEGSTEIVSAGEEIEVKGIRVKAVPAYNTDKTFHPKGFGLGFIIELNGKRIYHAGDTDLIPEMHSFGVVDVALLPVGGTYTMNATQAAEAAATIGAKLAVPMHYGSIVGSKEDAEKFSKMFSGKTIIMERE